jgi:hypothetical protein
MAPPVVESLRLGVHDLLDDGKQIEGAARDAVDACHRHHVAGREGVEHFRKLAPVAVRAGHVLPQNLGATRAAKLFKLRIERLAVGADAGIAEGGGFRGVLWPWFSTSFRSYVTESVTY